MTWGRNGLFSDCIWVSYSDLRERKDPVCRISVRQIQVLFPRAFNHTGLYYGIHFGQYLLECPLPAFVRRDDNAHGPTKWSRRLLRIDYSVKGMKGGGGICVEKENED